MAARRPCTCCDVVWFIKHWHKEDIHRLMGSLNVQSPLAQRQKEAYKGWNYRTSLLVLRGHLLRGTMKNNPVWSYSKSEQDSWHPSHYHQKLQLRSTPQRPWHFPAILGSFQVDRLRVWLVTHANSTRPLPVWDGHLFQRPQELVFYLSLHKSPVDQQSEAVKVSSCLCPSI